MAPAVRQVAQIFEDADAIAATNTAAKPQKKKLHNRVPSVGDVLRGRKQESSPVKLQSRITNASPSPLEERHINSPPLPKRVPLKDEDGPPRRPAHKKTGSTVSLKDFILGREKDKTPGSDGDSVSSAEVKMAKPKKTKSSTNLSGLLKMNRSKKDLNEGLARDQENVSPHKEPTSAGLSNTPIWAQFATQPLPLNDAPVGLSNNQKISIEEEIKLYTPRDYSEYRPSEQRNFYNPGAATYEYKPPQRPFLEHRSSRESIFKEHLEDEKRSKESLQIEEKRESIPAASDNHHIAAKLASDGSRSETSTRQSQSRPVSRVFDMLPSLKMPSRSSKLEPPSTDLAAAGPLSPEELDSAFEKVLDSLNIPFNMRDNMRRLTPGVKAGLIKGGRSGSGSSNTSIPTELHDVRLSARNMDRESHARTKSQDGDAKDSKKSRSRSRPRSRILTISKREDASPSKQDQPDPVRSRSKTRPKSVDISSVRSGSRSRPTSTVLTKTNTNGSDVATMPGDFIHYLREVQKPELVEVGKLHKLRLLLRNESVSWTDSFISQGGMDDLVQLLYRIMKIEWREEHEDSLLHENLLCLKALCTTSLALHRLENMADELFPALLSMLFDPERKGPSEFSTRSVMISLLFAHLSSAVNEDAAQLEHRARSILGYLKDTAPGNDKQPLDFVSQMHTSRPYRTWSREVVNVTKEVFWIFLHHLNVIPIVDVPLDGSSFAKAHFPPPRPPHPAAPYVGGVEWEATQYLANHLDLVNGLLASLPDVQSRNQLREDLKQSGWEKVMGGSLRTCKEKFYGGVHDGLRVWVSAGKSDRWPVEDVRAGPPREVAPLVRGSPTKKKGDEIPQLGLDIGGGLSSNMDDGWV